MSHKRQKNSSSRWASRCLLLVLYVFLLAPQCHSRFYSIANFYLFAPQKHGAHLTANKHSFEETTEIKVRHLSLDKRFRNKPSYNESACIFSTSLVLPGHSPASVKIVFPPSQPGTCSDAYLDGLSFRGPPCAC